VAVGARSRTDGWSRDLATSALTIARRFASGAAMWCISPRWPSHARHVAVEFVHPVVVGKRALPATCLTDRDVVAALRLAARAGDVVVAVAPADDGDVAAVMRHAPAWGLHTVWIGAGDPRPAPGAADHVLWLDTDVVDAAHGGGLVLVYHLLWELTHVCFEHPGLLTAEPGPGTGGTCVTCADEGRLAEVVAVLPGNRASVRSAGGLEDVDVTLIDVPSPGGLVLVHAGSAVAVVGEDP
jgi:hypothetical protein